MGEKDSGTTTRHFRSLERMYLAAPINQLYEPTIEVAGGSATIEMAVSPRFFHSAGSLHGSVYFKMLDDAAFFAANSLQPDHFVLTATFTTNLRQPVTGGRLRSVGRVVEQMGRRYRAEAELFDESGERVAHGDGVFVRSRILLREATGYIE
ncbi:MAG: PaaI family thioesterase [Gemmatimonadota bacterium]|nr:PaaI family thioesterase [Gemmatimonadota bacterium]